MLHSRRSTLVLEHRADEAPLWRYWGPRLPDDALPGLPLRDTRALPSFNLDFDQPLSLAPGFGAGWFGQSAVLAHRDGVWHAPALEVPATSLSFHLKELVHSGLVSQERQGRNLIYRAQFERMNALMGYLTENCCQGQACLPAQTTHCAC